MPNISNYSDKSLPHNASSSKFKNNCDTSPTNFQIEAFCILNTIYEKKYVNCESINEWKWS